MLNLATNTFNENETSYYHKSIGGYHAAKLGRYNDMIEHYISPEMTRLQKAVVEAGGDMTKVPGDSIWPVLNMLNAKYFILPLQDGQTVPVMNPYACGNAWFVDNVRYVKNANEEIDAVGKVNLRHTAVVDERFRTQVGQSVAQTGSSLVTLKKYEPNELTYEVQSDKGGVIVFSEIYYPGWTATVDGAETELGRADYILRALNVKPGRHTVVLTFKPKSVDNTETVAYVAYALLFIAVALGVFFEWRKRRSDA